MVKQGAYHLRTTLVEETCKKNQEQEGLMEEMWPASMNKRERLGSVLSLKYKVWKVINLKQVAYIYRSHIKQKYKAKMTTNFGQQSQAK